jgi:lipopolysaccharide/colanic/teichoic acid biosynthesis glycosyltransferase
MELAEKIKTRIIEEQDASSEISKGSYETYKRVFDVGFALILLPFLFPLMALIAILIKLDSKGPIIFANKRVGRGGKRFFCYKFRTMIENAEKVLPEILKDQRAEKEWKNCIKLKNDPRVTTFGAFLRKFSLDEIPQIFNVIKGNMSFVGPRPILEEEIPKYGRDFESYQNVRPGITGMWQISGRNDCDYSHRIRLLHSYIQEKNFLLDLKIILKTLPTVLSRRGAY